MVRLPGRLRPLFPYLKPAYVWGTGVVSPLTRALSRRHNGLLPTGFVASLDEAARREGGRCAVARPAETVTRPRQRGWPDGIRLSDTRRAETFAPVTVAELPGARVLGPHHAVVTGGGKLVDEVSHYFDTTRGSQHPLFLNPFPPRPLEVEGRLGVLAVRGDRNYYHFLMDSLPRIGVAEQASDIDPPHRWYVTAGAPVQRELLGLLKLSADRIIDADQYPHVRAESLVVPGWPAETEMNPPWVVAWLRERLLVPAGIDHTVRPSRRLFVTRGRSANNRSITNEAEVTAELQRHDFELIDPGAMSAVDQIRAFASAELVVAPHGAALANLVFCSPGARVVELFPRGSLLPDFWRLACGVPGLEYRYVSAVGRPWPRQTRQSTIVRDIVVDMDTLTQALADSTGRSRGDAACQ